MTHQIIEKIEQKMRAHLNVEQQNQFVALAEQSDKSKFNVQIAIYRDVWNTRRPCRWC